MPDSTLEEILDEAREAGLVTLPVGALGGAERVRAHSEVRVLWANQEHFAVIDRICWLDTEDEDPEWMPRAAREFFGDMKTRSEVVRFATIAADNWHARVRAILSEREGQLRPWKPTPGPRSAGCETCGGTGGVYGGPCPACRPWIDDYRAAEAGKVST